MLSLMILAAKNIDLIVKALKRDDTEKFMMKGLKITEEQVQTILSKPIRTLKALELKKMLAKLKELKAILDETKGFLKKPEKKILIDLNKLEKELVK